MSKDDGLMDDIYTSGAGSFPRPEAPNMTEGPGWMMPISFVAWQALARLAPEGARWSDHAAEVDLDFMAAFGVVPGMVNLARRWGWAAHDVGRRFGLINTATMRARAERVVYAAPRYHEASVMELLRCESATELLLGQAMARRGITFRARVQIGEHCVHFAVHRDLFDMHQPERFLAVMCDSDGPAMEMAGHVPLIRFTPDEVHEDADACASRVQSVASENDRI